MADKVAQEKRHIGELEELETNGESAEHPSIDFIVVHGLGGNGVASWSSAATEDLPESTWLREVLLAENKNARVLVFTYPSIFEDGGDVLSPRGLEDVARGLLSSYKSMSPAAGHEVLEKDQLLFQRPATPVAFLAHDLGGIIVKQALRMAEKDPNYSDIFKASFHAVFFGTPHRAPYSGTWVDALLCILLESPLVSTALQPSLASKLRSLETFLDELSAWFTCSPVRLCVANIYQAQGFDDNGVRPAVVDQSIAITGLVHELNIPCKATHSKMCKLRGDECNAYAVISKYLRVASAVEYRKCFARLSELATPVVMASDVEDGIHPTEESPAILKELEAWLNERLPSIIALTGGRGAGKSLLARTIYRKLRGLPGVVVAYFSFTETDARQSTVTAFLASVILQILNHDRDRFPRVQDLLHALEKRYAWTKTGLMSLFHSLMDTRHGLRPVHLVIDGFHRCNNWPSCEELLKILFSVVGNQDTLTPLKLALFYQDHGDVQQLIESLTGPRLKTLQLDHDGFSSPIQKFVRQEVAKLILENPYLLSMEEAISAALAECKNLIEVTLAIETIARARGDATPCTRMVLEQRIAEDFCVSTSDAASARLNHLSNWARTALGWIYCAKRPLSLDELSLAVALTDDKADFIPTLDAKRLPMDLSQRLIVEFGPFLGVHSGAVIFRNDNVRRFFSAAMETEVKSARPPITKSSASHTPDASARKGVIPTHSHIAKILMRYITSPQFLRLLKRSTKKTTQSVDLGLLALAEYAVRYLPIHYRMVTPELTVLDHLHNISEVRMWPRLTATFNPMASLPNVTALSNASVYRLAAQLGLTSVVTHLESAGKGMSDILELDRTIAVTLATWGGHEDTVNALLAGIPRTQESGAHLIQALQYSIWRGYRSTTKNLLEWIKESQFDASTDLEELVCQVAELGYEEDLALLLQPGQVRVDAAPDGQTPLQHAARNGHAGLVQLLLYKWEVDVDAKAGDGYLTPIQLAAERGHERVIQHLLAKNATTAELEREPRSDHTPLYLAAANGHEEAVRLLLTKVAKNELDSYKESPLIIACQKDHLGIAIRLIEAGVELHREDSQHHSALYYAVQAKNEHLAVEIVTKATRTLGDFKDIGDIFLLAAEHGLVKVVNMCKDVCLRLNEEKEAGIIEYTNGHGCTALHQASKYGRNKVVSLLLQSGANPDRGNRENVTPIIMAAVAGEAEVVSTLLRSNAKVDGMMGPDQSYTPLGYVVAMGKDTARHADALYELAKATENPDELDDYMRTPLHWAVSQGAVNMTKVLLLAPNVKPWTTGRYDWNALHFLASASHAATLEIAETLLSARLSVWDCDDDGWLPLHIAAREGNIALVECLWRQDKDTLSAKVSNGRTVLHFAVYHPQQLEWLLNNHSSSRPPLDIDALDNQGHSALRDALRYHLTDSAKVLLDGGASPSAGSKSQEDMMLHEVADRGDVIMGRLLLSKHRHLLSAKTKNQVTALHHAILQREPKFAEMLLDEFYPDAGAEVVRHDLSLPTLDTEDTPLISAVKLRQKNVVRKLLDLGAETEHKNRDGRTALLCAVNMARRDDTQMIESLFEGSKASDRPPNATWPKIDACGDRSHPTALYIAAQAGEMEAVQALIGFGADKDVGGGLEGTALCAAATSGWSEIGRFLLERGASPKSDGFVFANALGGAIWSYSYDLIKSILSCKTEFEVDTADYQGRTALHIAASRGDMFCLLDMLPLVGDKLPGLDEQGRYMLHHAATSGNLELFKDIHGRDTDILDKGDKDGWTPLHWACRQDSNYEIVEYIFSQSPKSITCITKDEWTPLNIAVFHGATYTASFIQSRLQSLPLSEGEQPPDWSTEWERGQHHRGISCDGCLIHPIVGVAWTMDDLNFDFCFKCNWHASKTHPDQTFTAVPYGEEVRRKPVRVGEDDEKGKSDSEQERSGSDSGEEKGDEEEQDGGSTRS